MAIDLVCGMDLKKNSSTREISREGKKFYFCGEGCKSRFEKDPARFENEPLIILENVWKVFKTGDIETRVLRGINFRIHEGDFICVIGASGSGKSTLLNMIGLLDRPSSGRIILGKEDVASSGDFKRAELRSKIFGFVFQQYNLIPWLTAYENITLPLIFSGKNIQKDKIESMIVETGLQERVNHRPFELSGGEQQRVALLRALACDPRIILGDEPTGNLDSATGNKILDILINLNKVQKKTLIVVTHDADIAGKADQIITLKDGEMVADHQIQREIYTE